MTTARFCWFRILDSSKTSLFPFGIPLFNPIIKTDRFSQLTRHGTLVLISIGSFQAHHPLVVPEVKNQMKNQNLSVSSAMQHHELSNTRFFLKYRLPTYSSNGLLGFVHEKFPDEGLYVLQQQALRI
jgi:hypothetical protein